jgi:hypothetical protein
MAFYYFSLFSILPLGIAYGILALIFWGIAWGTRGIRRRGLILSAVGVVFLLLPISEELWIAWNFGQACKEAGTFIQRKVQVEGFYDDTAGWGPRQLAESKYQFMESRDVLHRRLLRVERTDDASRNRALAWYAEKNPSAEQSKDLYVVYPLNDKEQVVVSPNGMNAWRVTKLDRPTARYWYAVDQGERLSHKLDRQQATVTDKQSAEVIARYVRYSREAPWYFIGLDRPNLGCDEPGGGPHSKRSFLIYREALTPSTPAVGAAK